MGAIEIYASPAAAKPARTPAAEAGLAAAQAIVGGSFDRMATTWREGSAGEKELLLHLAGCPVVWARWQWASIPAQSKVQIRERARAMRGWLDRLVGAEKNG